MTSLRGPSMLIIFQSTFLADARDVAFSQNSTRADRVAGMARGVTSFVAWPFRRWKPRPLSNVPVPRLGLGFFISHLQEKVMFKNTAATDLTTKLIYGSIAAATFVFVAMLFLTQMHP